MTNEGLTFEGYRQQAWLGLYPVVDQILIISISMHRTMSQDFSTVIREVTRDFQ